MFGHEVKNVYVLNNNGSYSIVSLIEKEEKVYCVAFSSHRYMGAAPGSQWEIITDEEDYSPCIASELIASEEDLFIPKYEYQKQELTFPSYEEMVNYWNTNSVRVGDRNSGNGIEMVFALPSL